VDTIIRNNKGVKTCFFEEKTRTGAYPSRTEVKFTVQTDGSVDGARVVTTSLAGTELDACLGRAFSGLQFPAFDGNPLTMTYPFVI
jgi:hypothetical protein